MAKKDPLIFHRFRGIQANEGYVIKWGYAGHAPNGAKAAGEYSGGVVTVDPRVSPEFFWEVLVHEVVHSAEETHQMKLCEAEVDIIATHVVNALRPWLKAPPKPPKR